MGKGDKKTTKGKRIRGSYGKTRRPRREMIKTRAERAIALAGENAAAKKKKAAKPKAETAPATEPAKKTVRKPKAKKEE
jgi:30S ribosomal protein S31